MRVGKSRVPGGFRARQQIHDVVLKRAPCRGMGGRQQRTDAFLASVKNIALPLHLGERLKQRRQRGVRLGFRNVALPREDLPHAGQRLHHSRGIRAKGRVSDLRDAPRRVQKRDDGRVGQHGRLGEQRILRAHRPIVGHQTVHRGRLQRLGAIALQVGQRHEDFQRLVVRRLPA